MSTSPLYRFVSVVLCGTAGGCFLLEDDAKGHRNRSARRSLAGSSGFSDPYRHSSRPESLFQSDPYMTSYVFSIEE